MALRAFDAAARLGSFREAAEELGVTPGAVSRHIKALEMRLGLRLFDRFNRSVVLTADGRRLAQGVADAFEVIPEEMLILAGELGTGAARELPHAFERENIRTVMDAELWRRTVA